MNKIKKVRYLIFLIFLVSILISGCFSDNEVKWGDAPDFTLTTIDGETFTLSDYLGKVIVIDLMATWCSPCIQQMSQLEAVVDEFKDQIIVISIDVDKGETTSDILNKFGEYVDKWTFILDTDEIDVSSAYQVTSIPKIVIISQNGNIYYSHVGYMDYSALSAKINELLK
ncbi:MAG: TlpA family protein disulfide reductase [Thermoplasmatales archaeon]|nr:MAG: TlpA family protein disulfide reductase [Thermoplasmatales archaeon]